MCHTYPMDPSFRLTSNLNQISRCNDNTQRGGKRHDTELFFSLDEKENIKTSFRTYQDYKALPCPHSCCQSHSPSPTMGRTTFTSITPLPSSLSRETVIAFLHDHVEMIDLNPLVIERHPISPPPHALPEEQHCVWYSLTDKISYLPGGMVSGQVTYTCAFHDLPQGLQTHCYAPMGLDIRDRWSVGGSLPGEPPEPVELGLNAPQSGLYLREDVDLRCNSLMATFVKKTMKKAHGSLVDKLAEKAHISMFSKSSQDFGSDTRSSQSSTPSSAWMVPQGIPPPRSDTTATAQPGPLLPIPKTKKSVPTPGPPYHQQHSEQTFGPYGYQTPPRAAGSQQNVKTQPQSDSQSTASGDELFHPERASQQSFNIHPPSNPRAKTPPDDLAYSEQVSKPPPPPDFIVQPNDAQASSSREELFHPDNTAGNRHGFSLRPPSDPQLQEKQVSEPEKVSDPQHNFIIEPLNIKRSREELFHPENTAGNRQSFILQPPSDPQAQRTVASELEGVSQPQHSFTIQPPIEPNAKSFQEELFQEELFHPKTAERPQGTFVLRPPSDPRITESPVGLSHSGTVYRGKSRPEHYTEFSSSNPYED